MTDDPDPIVIHIDMAAKRPELPEYDPNGLCPHCGESNLETAWGLGGGGMGPYTYCPHCERITSKTTIDEDEA